MNALRTAALLASLLAAAPAFAAKKPLGPGERVDLNRASVTELMRLPGVGRKKAEAIAARRKEHPYRRAEDVTAVKGVSASWLAKVRPHLSAAEPPRPSAAERPHAASPARAGGPRPQAHEGFHRLPARNAP